MSTDPLAAIGRLPATRFVAHRLLGDRPHRTAVALAYLLALVALFVLRYAAVAAYPGAVPPETLAPAIDGLADVLILAVAATVTFLPIVYAAWNGGPLLAAVGPLVPVALGDLLSGSYVLDLDAVVALTVGAAAAAVAVYADGVRATGSARPWRVRAADEDELLVVTAVTTVALVAAVEFVTAMPSYVVRWYAPFAALFVVAIGLSIVHWSAWQRDPPAGR